MAILLFGAGWQSKTAAMSGKLYVVGDSHSLEGKNEISVHNGQRDCWESIKGVSEDAAPVLAWGPELVSLGGRLCMWEQACNRESERAGQPWLL